MKTIKPRIPTIGQGSRKTADGKIWSVNAKRGNAAQRGYGSAWRRLRALILERDTGLCQPCKEAGRITVATQVDHIKPKFEGGTDDEANLQSICSECHQAKSKREGQRASR